MSFSNEQRWVQLFTDHPSLVRIISYMMHSENLDYYFIYTSLHNVVLGNNIMFIAGEPLKDEIYDKIVAMIYTFEGENPSQFAKLNEAFNQTEIVIPPKLICKTCNVFGKPIQFYNSSAGVCYCSKECKDPEARALKGNSKTGNPLESIDKFNTKLQTKLLKHFSGIFSIFLRGVLTFYMKDHQFNLDLLVVLGTLTRMGIGSHLIKRLKSTMLSVPQGYIFVIASTFLNETQWYFYASNGFRIVFLSNEDRIKQLHDQCNYFLVFSSSETFSNLKQLTNPLTPDLWKKYHAMLVIYVCQFNTLLWDYMSTVPGILFICVVNLSCIHKCLL